ncbi:MAG: hypothetical protein AAGC95_01570 [Pseudomonadota bacterium]
MPSITDPSLSTQNVDTGYNAETISNSNKFGVGRDAPGEQVLTIEHRQEGGERSVIGTLAVNHAPQAPRPMSLTEMMLQLTTMADALQGERVKISDGMIENDKDLIEQRSEDREKMFDKVERMQKKMKAQQKSAETWGWIGTAAGALITAASMGSLGPVAASCMILSTGVGLGNQIATSAGAYDKLSKDDPEAAKALNYSMFAIQIALSLGGLVAASRSATALTEGGEEIAKGATKAGSGASKSVDVADKTAEVAGKTGSSMSGASSSQQMADDLVQGLSDASRVLVKNRQAADEAVDVGQAAAKSANGASGGAANGAKTADKLSKADKFEVAEAFGNKASRMGHAMEGVATTKQTVDKVNIAVLSGASINTNADLQKVNRDLTLQRSLLNELVARLSDQVTQAKEATKAAMESQNKLHNASISVASNLGANTSQAV